MNTLEKTWGRAALALQPHWSSILVVLVYFLFLGLFDRGTAREGLVTPHGTVNAPLVALGILVIALRVFVVFVVPARTAYRIAAQVADRIGRSRISPTVPPARRIDEPSENRRPIELAGINSGTT